ncbi:hypothetical protein QE367_000381 [Microbacterium paludicola]|uniref:ABC transporter permease n=1 Tax=Microbacterium paludicola TaxID=300019 RepID=A0ABU1HX03_9MICO|nr:hypothetical protein [Microbacterium paludicola]MDR6166177.1 hypothetical protein [Microbacterium paludicola]
MRRTVGRFFARHGFIVCGCLGLAGIFVFFGLSGGREGLHLWSDRVSGIGEATVVTGTVASGLAAWSASRWVDLAGDRIASSARPRSLVLLRHIASVVLPLVAAFPVALAVITAQAMVTKSYGAAYGPWLAAIAGTLLLAATGGYALGFIIGRRWFTAPLVAALFFGCYVFAQSSAPSFGVRSLYPVILNRDTEFARYYPETMLGQAGFFVALSIASFFLLVSMVTTGRRRWLSVVALFTAASLAAGSSIGVLERNGQYLTGYNSRDFVCLGDAPVLCLNRGYAQALEPLHERFDSLNEKVAGTDLSATKLEQNVEGIGDQPSDGARSVYLEAIGDADLDFAVSRYVQKYGGLESCYRNERPYENLLALIIVDTWLSGFDEYGLDMAGEAELGAREWQRFKGASTTEGNRWLVDNADRYFSCEISLAELP